MDHPHPEPADCLKAQILNGDAVLEPTPEIVEACIPLADVIGGGAEVPKCPRGPPTVAARLEARERSFP